MDKLGHREFTPEVQFGSPTSKLHWPFPFSLYSLIPIEDIKIFVFMSPAAASGPSFDLEGSFYSIYDGFCFKYEVETSGIMDPPLVGRVRTSRALSMQLRG